RQRVTRVGGGREQAMRGEVSGEWGGDREGGGGGEQICADVVHGVLLDVCCSFVARGERSDTREHPHVAPLMPVEDGRSALLRATADRSRGCTNGTSRC